VQKISALYRYRRLIGNLAFDDYHFPAAMLAEKAQAALGLMDWEMIVAYNTTQRAERSLSVAADSQARGRAAIHALRFVRLHRRKLNWITFKNFCEYAQKKGARFCSSQSHHYDFVNDRRRSDDATARRQDAPLVVHWDLVIPEFRRRTIQ
jgi:hypothetical protein